MRLLLERAEGEGPAQGGYNTVAKLRSCETRGDKLFSMETSRTCAACEPSGRRPGSFGEYLIGRASASEVAVASPESTRPVVREAPLDIIGPRIIC